MFYSIEKISGGFAVVDFAGNQLIGYRSEKTAAEVARGYTLSLFTAAETYDIRRTAAKAYLTARASRVAPINAQLELF